MSEIKPFIKCVDYWPVKIPPEKLKAYNEMIEEGQIRKHHVTYNRVTGSTIVEYFAIAPHEWILEELARRSQPARPGGDLPEDLVDMIDDALVE